MPSTRSLSLLSTVANALIWVSAVIVLGITAWFMSLTEGDDGRHLTYNLVVAVFTVVAWPAVFFLSWRHGGGSFLLPLSVVFSFLWLAAVVVSFDDWAETSCRWTWPLTLCSYKHTVIAFNFIAFFFTAMLVLIEGYFSRGAVVTERRHRHTTTRV